MTVKIEEGQVFNIPLNDIAYAIGVIARVHHKKGGRGKPYIVFAYFFGPYKSTPPVNMLQHLKAKDAVMRLKCSILYIHNGRWRIIGKISDWKREDWPLPIFYRHDLLRGTVIEKFSDEDLVSPVEVFPYVGEDISLSDEQMNCGSLAVEIMLRQKLNISE